MYSANSVIGLTIVVSGVALLLVSIHLDSVENPVKKQKFVVICLVLAFIGLVATAAHCIMDGPRLLALIIDGFSR